MQVIDHQFMTFSNEIKVEKNLVVTWGGLEEKLLRLGAKV